MVLDTVRPARFNIPGNDPGCWLPDRWTDASKGDFSLTQARIEQAYCLSDAIEQNAQLAGISAAKMHKAMDITLRTATLAGILLLAIITCRHFNIREPTSEIYRTTATEKSPAKGRLPTVNFLSNGQKHS
jgi:hypothetical protein